MDLSPGSLSASAPGLRLASAGTGKVLSLHVHPPKPGGPLRTVPQLTLEAGRGIAEDTRFFGRTSSTGEPSRRQVSLIEREQLATHAATLGLMSIRPGAVRSNIETEGIDLVALVGRQVEVGTAVLQIQSARTPCAKMDAIAPGLKDLMSPQRQGVLATVVRSGLVRCGDRIRALPPSAAAPAS